MSTEEETQIPLKILVDKARNKVLFAETDHNFVDILFSFLTLPMGTIVRLIGEKENPDSKLSIGSFSSLYKGLANLPAECFWTEEECKAVLLNPINSLDRYCHQLKLNVEDTVSTKYFRCHKQCIRNGNDTNFFSFDSSAKCICGQPFSVEIERDSFSNSSPRKEGMFVTTKSSFIVTDDLHVKPNLIGSSIPILVSMGITDMTNIEEMTISIGLQQVLNLLRTALFSAHPLSDLFLQKAQSAHELVRHQLCNTSLPIISKVTSNSDSNSTKFYMKACVRKSNGELLFVQAGGDFIDFIFSFIAMPLGTVAWLLSGTTNIGPSIDNLYNSVSSLNVGQYIKSQDLKDMLVQPPLPTVYLSKNCIFTLKQSNAHKYLYEKYFYYETFVLLSDPKLRGEFVRGTTMFMVTNDLVVTPLSSISALSHLNNLKIPLSDVVEYEVTIGVEEALEILKASLTSSAALSQGLRDQLLKNPKLESWYITEGLKLYHKLLIIIMAWCC